MVDGISRNDNTIQEGLLNALNLQVGVEKTNKDDASDKTSTLGALDKLFGDNATISSDARKAYESEREMLQFARLAQRIPNSVDTDKVSRMKQMIDAGKLNEYFSSLNNTELADSILKGPAGAYLGG